MTYNGTLSGVTQIRHVSHSLAQGKVAVIPQTVSFPSGPTANDTEVQLYGYDFLSFLGRNFLPNFIVQNRAYAAHGRFVFFNSDGSKYFVAAQADASSGLLNDYGVATFNTTLSEGISFLSNGVVNGASFLVGSTAGAIGTIFGANLSAFTIFAETTPLPTSLNGVTVRVNGIAAPLFFVSPFQINFQIPWELPPNAAVVMSVSVDGITSPVRSIPLRSTAPGIFTANSSGTGQGAVLIANSPILAAPSGSIPGIPSRPATRDGFISVFCVGLGDVVNRPPSGARAPSSPLASTLDTPTVTIGGVPADVVFSGLAPGFVALYQVNVRVPLESPVGNAVPLELSIGGRTSNTVTIAVQ